MSQYTWVVINQTQPPNFQKLIERLSKSLGPCLLLTGNPYPSSSSTLKVIAGPQYQRKSMSSRLRSWASFVAFATRQVRHIPGTPFVLTVTNPPMLPHLGLALSRLRKWRTGILVWDLYPEHIVERKWLSKNNPVISTWRALNRRAYEDASVVITIGDGMAQSIRHQALKPEMPIAVIPNWADTSLLKPIAKAQNWFARTHCKKNAITVLYSGNLGASHSLDALLHAAKELSSVADLEFLIIGEGLRAREIEEQARQLSLSNLKTLPYQSWETLPLSLAVGDIAVVSQERATSHLSVPSKTYSALAVGSAILALTSPQSDLGDLVTKNQVGSVCNPEDSISIAQAILKYVNDRSLLETTRARSRKLAVSQFSEQVIEKQFLSELTPWIQKN